MTLPIPHYDVIIIGAGSIGAPAAFYLVNAGLKVLVVDSVPSVGQGSNKKAIGGIRATHSDPAKVRLCLRSIEIFKTWKEIYGDEIEWVQGGYSFVAYREQEEKALKAVAVNQRALGLNIDWYDRQQLLRDRPRPQPGRPDRRHIFTRRRECLTLAGNPRLLRARPPAGAPSSTSMKMSPPS